MRRTISAANRPEDLQNPHGEQASKRGSAKDREKSCDLAPSRPGGGKDRADLSIRFRLLGRRKGRGDEAAGVCETPREERERERCGKNGESGERETEKRGLDSRSGEVGLNELRVLAQWKQPL